MIGVLTLMLTFVALFLAAFHDPEPNGLELSVAGPEAAVRQLQARVDRAGVGEIELVRAASPAAARTAVLEQESQAALLLDPRSPQLLVASAGSPFAAQALEGIVARAAAAGGARLAVEDLRPLPEHDSRGLSSVFLAIGVTVPSFVLGAMLWALGGAVSTRVFAGLLLAFAVTSGLLVTVVADELVGAVDGAFWQVGGLLALLNVAVAGAVAGLGRLAGPPGLALAALLLLLIALPSSGGPVGHLMLPDFYRTVSQALPTGAAMTALRDTVYFDGHQTLVPVLALLAWASAGIGMWAIGTGLRGRRAPAQPAT